jgi:4-hydroxy-tetrahydrodipicolinate synthase
MNTTTRRSFLSGLGASALALSRPAAANTGKPFRGVFIIMATPYTAANAVDYEDLAREVDFMARSRVQGMVWPQLASEYARLTKEERMRGMEVIAKAAKGKAPALVLGVQGPNKNGALEYLRHAETLEPDALIAIPPTEANSLDDVRSYYRALAQATRRPIFVQTTGGAKGITLTVEFLIELAREFPHCGYVKEETNPVIDRMQELAKNRPAIKSVFSGGGGRGMMYEWRLGMDGTMPGAPLSDIYAQIWEMYQAGKQAAARELFAKLLLMMNLEQQISGVRPYIMKKRGVFKTTQSRQAKGELSPQAMAEIDFNFEALKPYLRWPAG